MKNSSDSVALALAAVRERIVAAAERAGRSPGDVSLLAVTKTVPVERIQAAVMAGQLLFGENRVQEARDKVPALGAEVTWHMIGHLQKNKVKAAAGIFDTIESVDSVDLAVALNRRAGEEEKRLGVFVQVKEAEEESKDGVGPESAPQLIEKICSLPNLELKGLMTIPPWPADPEDSRPYFSRLRRWRDRWDGDCCPGGALRELSMGMTADFEVAVEEGATLVRVGSAIFGSRSQP